MGCACSNRDYPNPEEQSILEGESKLGYNNHNIHSIISVLQSFHLSKKVSLKNFKDFSRVLSLNYEENKELIHFYQKLTENSFFPVKYLVALAVVLSSGPVESKINILIDYWSEDYDTITREDFAALIDFLFYLTVDLLPTIRALPNMSNYYTTETMEHYLNKARNGRTICKGIVISQTFSKDKIERIDLVSWAISKENERWFTSSSIRKTLRDFGKDEIHRRRQTQSIADLNITEVNLTLEED